MKPEFSKVHFGIETRCSWGRASPATASPQLTPGLHVEVQWHQQIAPGRNDCGSLAKGKSTIYKLEIAMETRFWPTFHSGFPAHVRPSWSGWFAMCLGNSSLKNWMMWGLYWMPWYTMPTVWQLLDQRGQTSIVKSCGQNHARPESKFGQRRLPWNQMFAEHPSCFITRQQRHKTALHSPTNRTNCHSSKLTTISTCDWVFFWANVFTLQRSQLWNRSSTSPACLAASGICCSMGGMSVQPRPAESLRRPQSKVPLPTQSWLLHSIPALSPSAT